jgi:ribosomal protein L32
MNIITPNLPDIGEYIYTDRICKYCGCKINIHMKYCMATIINRSVFCRCPNTACNKLVCVMVNEDLYTYSYILTHTDVSNQDAKEIQLYNDELASYGHSNCTIL